MVPKGERNVKWPVPERDPAPSLAYTAWLAALGLLTMPGLADAMHDALVHDDEDLLDTLTRVFDSAGAG